MDLWSILVLILVVCLLGEQAIAMNTRLRPTPPIFQG